MQVCNFREKIPTNFEITHPEVSEMADEESLKYGSCEINWGWEDPEFKDTKPVLEALSLTNRPYVKRMAPIERVLNLSEFAAVQLEEEETGPSSPAPSPAREHEKGNPNHGSDGKFASGTGSDSGSESKPSALDSFIDSASKDAKSYDVHEFGKVSDDDAKRIKDATGVDVAGYSFVADSYSLRHVLKEHSDEKSEIARGNVPVTKEDFSLIPDVLKNPDSVEDSGATPQGLKSITFKKKIGDVFVCVEEVRTAQKTLNLKTFYKRPAPASKSGSLSEPTLDITSETLRGAGAPPIIRQKADDNHNFLDESSKNPANAGGIPMDEKTPKPENTEAVQLSELKLKLAEASAREALTQTRLAELELNNRNTLKELRMTQIKTRLMDMGKKGKLTPANYNRIVRLAEVLIDTLLQGTNLSCMNRIFDADGKRIA